MSHDRARTASTSRRLKRYLLTASALAIVGAVGTTAFAAEQSNVTDQRSQSAKAEQPVGEIIITGSRIKRTTDFDTPNPTTIVDDSYLHNLGIVNLGDAMIQIPSNVSTFTPQATGNSNFFAGSTIANLRGINPFFGSRTLTLVDGRRHVPTNQGDSVDLNFIPSIILQRMDVVTGGASAAYGSGAISGVNNIILNRTLEGAKVDADYGITGHGDGDNYHIAAAAGTKLFDGRGHLVIAGEYQNQDEVGCINARSWCARNIGLLNNALSGPGTLATSTATAQSPYTQADPNLPNYSWVDNVRANGISYNGVFWNAFLPSSTTQVYQSNADGTGTIPFTLGGPAGVNTNAFGNVIGGDGLGANYYTNLIGKTDRHTFHGHFDYDITDSINASIDGEYGKVTTRNSTGAWPSRFISVQPDNAYVLANPALQTAQAAGALFPGGFGFFNKDWTSQLDSFSKFDTTVWSVVGDLNGSIGDSSWTWDLYVSHGHTKRVQLVNDNPHLNALNYALDAVVDPISGDPVCRATLLGSTDPVAQGCVPINPFGTAALTQAQHDYGFGYLQENELVNQSVAALNLTGNLFEGFGAGPVGLAVGGEFRKENIKNLNLSAAPSTDYFIQYGDSFAGKVDVWETYGEVNVPILKDVAFAQNLELDGAVRYSHYKNTGQGPIFDKASHGLTTWKLSAIWDVTNWARIRGSQSRDARAGNFRELYYGQVLHAGGTFGYCGGFLVDPCDIILQGNPAVKPETSDTSTAGVVLTPGGPLDGFQFAADYYFINLKNGITPAGGQTQDLLALCRAAGTMTCSNALGSAIFADAALTDVLSVTDLSYNARS